MTAALAALCGAAVVAGLLLVVTGIRGRPPRPPKPSRAPRRPIDRLRVRLALAAAAGLGVALLTRWPVGTLLAAGLGWWWPTLYGTKAAKRAAIARVEAVAAWTEMLRDTMAAAAGLEQAILSTVAVAPDQIRAEVAGLAARLEGRQPIGAALRGFADELADPSADRVVVSLILASEQEFAIRFESSEIANAANIGDFLGLIEAKQ